MAHRTLRAAAAAAALAAALVLPACRREPPAPPALPDTETVGVKEAEPDGRPGQPGRDPGRNPGPPARPAAPGAGPVARREAPGRLRQDARARRPRPGHGRRPPAGRPCRPSRRTSSPAATSENILEPDEEGQLSYTGLVFSPDGRCLYMSNVNGSVKVFAVGAGRHGRHRRVRSSSPGRRAAPRARRSRPGWPSPATAGGSTSAATCPTACSSSRRRPARSCGPSTSGSPPSTSSWPRGKAYVSNWGGRRPGPGDLTGPAGHGTEVRVDPVRHIACEGLDQRRRPGLGNASRPRSSPSSTPRPWPSPRTAATSSAPTPRPTTSASSTRRPTRRSRRSGPSRARPTSSAPRPTPSPSPPTARRSSSPTARRTPSR
ncbi:MAG: hypothetical protein M0C28_20065 [Candidatus Moduliflexus flocculans]|nr:hypothetical protein [Candidatus Moduliflexus flocculans]